MQKEIVSFLEINDFSTVAESFRSQLLLPENADVAIEFPLAVERYSGDRSEVVANLEHVRDLCAPGVREQFVVFAGGQAVGMSVVQVTEEVPVGIDQASPNLGGFMLEAWRSKGMATFSLKHMLGIVDANFGGQAWTVIRKRNHVSRQLATSCGLRLQRDIDDRLLFTYKQPR